MILRASLEWILSLLLLLALAIGLCTPDFFYDPTSFSFYGFCITSFLFVIASSLLFLRVEKPVLLKAPILLFGVWCCYILIQYLNNSAVQLFTIYFLALYFLLVSTTVLFSQSGFRITIFLYGILLLSTFESLCCILQFLGFCKSQSTLYSVTGSYNNPNVTAIFLALTTPVFFYLFQKKYKWLIRISFLVLLIALLLLKCRAALIGTFLSVIVFYGLEYDILGWAKDRKNKTTAKALLILALLILIPLGSYLYNAKKASADGRKFIWKVSGVMATKKPLTGYGYGYFEKEYNLYQASYIKSGKAAAEELANAGPVLMPHNELLYNAVEGGSIGLILMILFFGSLLFTIKQQKKITENDSEIEASSKIKKSIFHLSYAGITAFIGMSIVNSSIQIMPLMTLLVLYTAIICSVLKPLHLPLFPKFPINDTVFSCVLIITAIILSGFLVWTVSGIATADKENKKAALLQKEKHYYEALQIMQTLKNSLADDRNYWKNLGIIYMKTGDYQQAIGCFATAKKWSSLPDLYLASGISYEKLRQYPKAIAEYKLLVLLLPSKFGYRYRLMQAYFKNKDIINTIITAKEIIALEPKVPSPKVEQYKKTARSLLNKIEFERTVKQKVSSMNGQFLMQPFKIKS